MYLDSDDMLASGALEKLFRTAEKKQLDILLFNGINFYDNDLPAVARRVRSGKMIIKDYGGICTGQEMFTKMQEQQELYSAATLFFLSKQFIVKSAVRFHEGIFYEDTAYTFELLLRANRVDYMNEVLYQRRLRKDSITTQVKRFDHSYGSYLGYLDMYQVFQQVESHLGLRTQGAVRSRMPWMIDLARRCYMQMPEQFVGEEYGLRAGFVQFYGLIGSYCGKLKQQEIINEKLVVTKKQLNQYELQMQEINSTLIKTVTQLNELRNELRITKRLLNGAKGEVTDLKKSTSFRIGRVLTWPLRKIRDLFR